MKTVYTLLFCFGFLFSCAQKEINKEDITNEENVKKVTNIYNEVKRYDYNPTYTLHIEKAANFSFEALINDFPVFEEYNPRIMSGSKPINHAILKSGKQKLTIRMTPPVDKEYNMGHEIDMGNIALKLSINYGEYVLEKVNEFKEALRYELPAQKGKLPYYEVNLEFDAIAPYENDIEGWQNGADLTKEDKDKLLKEVEAFYKELIEYYNTKDVNALAFKYYKKQFEMEQAHYVTKMYESQMVVDAWVKDVNELAPFVFDQYMLRFYGRGKMVALVKTDKYYINLSTLMREDPQSGKSIEYKMFLYRPKPGAPLEVIR
ncbi:hypothetical protein [Flavobacterium hercynium]|uniref:Uncharacterized protein n=1 Tax=Flavobacterium hercynium TaxID=387094 RepID=A0A226HJQ7_9FLAO|nr:hypothetical protein [Flavobacterium hercynium]OXA94098.1 hypothetical protein B0A66_05305 [Flavobacterium hercynium]SMP33118.1 hypothetical protein SAMN06265346_11627 [Flavobacterium hercynium]